MTTAAENETTGGRHSGRLQAAILSISLIVLSANTVSAILGDLRESFPGVDKVRLQSLLTVTSATTLVCIVLAGLLAGALGTRRVLLTGLAVYTIAGTAPAFLTDFENIYWSRVALGAGIGLVYPFSVSLIAGFFHGGLRSRLMGLQFSAANVGLAAMLAAAGFLAGTRFGWHASFWVHGIGAVVFFSVLFFVPEPPRPAAGTERAAGSYRVTGSVLAKCLLMGVYNMLFVTVFFCLAMMVREAGFGDASGIGLALTGMTLASMAAAAAFGPLFARLGPWLGALSAATLAAGFLLLHCAGDMETVTAALLVLGAGNAFLWPLGNMAVADTAPEGSAAFCLALLQAALNLGAFVSPHVFGALGRAFGDESGGFAFFVCFLAMAAGAAGLTLRSLAASAGTAKRADGMTH